MMIGWCQQQRFNNNGAVILYKNENESEKS